MAFSHSKFIICKYRSSFLGETRDEWCRVAAHKKHPLKEGSRCKPFRTGIQVIPRALALDLIREYGLVPKVDGEYGKIWDTPDSSFKAEYGKIIDIKDYGL